jgi:NAD(P)H-hydrate epimerase
MVHSGNSESTGASRLAARAGLRIGAGVVSILSPRNALAIHACHLTAIMIKRCDTYEEMEKHLYDPRVRGLILGPAGGVGKDMRELVKIAAKILLKTNRALILDADALTSFEDNANEFAALGANNLSHSLVMTPHEGEFKRLFSQGALFIDPLFPRNERVLIAARLSNAIVVLKGHQTLIASPDGRCVTNTNGVPWLATAGSGDVLCGLIAGLITQGMPAFEAACAGVWCHARAADLFGAGLIADDLPEQIPAVLREILTLKG